MGVAGEAALWGNRRWIIGNGGLTQGGVPIDRIVEVDLNGLWVVADAGHAAPAPGGDNITKEFLT